jgi:hypothetical protein
MELAKVATSIACSPASHALRVIGVALGKPDLAAQAIDVLQEDIVRLYSLVQEHIARIDEELRAKIDGIELAEVVLQSATNMGQTASVEKRRLMQNVVLNGLEDLHDAVFERRLFVQAVLDLDLMHIDFLKDASEQHIVDPVLEELTPAIVQPLVARGFLVSIQSSTGFSFDAPDRLPVSTSYEITPLGQRFLSYLASPQ